MNWASISHAVLLVFETPCMIAGGFVPFSNSSISSSGTLESYVYISNHVKRFCNMCWNLKTLNEYCKSWNYKTDIYHESCLQNFLVKAKDHIANTRIRSSFWFLHKLHTFVKKNTPKQLYSVFHEINRVCVKIYHVQNACTCRSLFDLAKMAWILSFCRSVSVSKLLCMKKTAPSCSL